WRSYAEALYDWLQTCQANGWEWDDVEEGHLRAYRNQMLYHPSSVTGRAYSTRTVNGRLRRVAMFYNWAFRRGLVGRVPFEYDTARAPVSADAQLLAHLRAGDTLPALDLTVREYRTIPTALSVEDLRRVRGHLGSRDALMADWAVSTGARRAEVLSLAVSDIPDSHALENTPFVPIPITGKGGRRRALQVPLPIIDRTNRYIAEDRRTFLRRHGVDPNAASDLWIGAEGRPVTAKTLTKRFAPACDKAGVRATFHSLRHTYAIFMLATLTRRLRHEDDGHVNAVKTLQLLLGHVSLHTTSTYLNAVRPDPQLLSGSINDLYQTLR
ncbi:MAG: tyrosine-type recombinase/integrase, partial [Chloroflexi bacterium]|nr:tyrosine-type recombinase/integrase [Chloroflexota bacterium]